MERGCPSGKKKISLADVAEGKAGIEELLAQMSGEEVISLIGGQPKPARVWDSECDDCGRSCRFEN